MRILGFFSILLLFTGILNAEESVQHRTALSYKDYLQKIKSTLPEVKSNRIALQRAENEIKRAKGAGDVFLSAGAEGYSNRQYTGIADRGNVKGYSYYAGAEKKIVSTGTGLSTTYGYSKKSYRDFSLKNDYSTYEPSLSVKVTQPLLYNFLGKVDQYSEKNAKMQFEIEKLKVIENNKTILNSYKKLYFEWISCGEMLKNLERSIRNSRQLKEQTLRKVRAGLADNDDYQKTVTSLLGYESQYSDYRKSLKTIENRLSVYIDVSGSFPSTDAYEAYFKKADLCSYEDVDFTKTISSKVIEVTMKSYQYSKGVCENKLLPEFNVFASVTRKDISDNTTCSMGDSDYRVGFEFKYKLGNNAAESVLNDVKLQMKSLRYEYESTLKNYTKNLLNFRESASGTKNQIRIQNCRLESLRSQLATEKKKHRQARLNLSYVINTQNSITSVETDLINNRYRLIACYVDYIDMIKQVSAK